MSLGFLFDDQFDGTALGRRLGDTARVIDHMTAAIEHPPSSAIARVHPFSFAATDLLAGLSEVMSPVWMRRQRHHLARWWSGILRAVAHRATGTGPMPFEERLAARRLDVGMDAFSDLLEVGCGWEMPPALAAVPQIQRMRNLLTDITVYHNDMYSAENDRADGNDDNVLLAWQAEGNTAESAVERAVTQTQRLVDEFAALATRIPALAAPLELSQVDQLGLQTWTGACALYLSGQGRSQAVATRYADVITDIAHDHHLDEAVNGWPTRSFGP